MKRHLAAILAVVIVVSCGDPQAAATPQPAPNINRSRMDLAYTAIASGDLHRVSSRTLLVAALAAVRLQATETGGTVDVATPDFADIADAQISDFTLFAQAVEAIARRNPQLTPGLIADSAIDAMVKATPDCFTSYVKTISDIPDAVGLQSRMLPGKVGYVAWHAFNRDGAVEIRKALDSLLAQGARAWLFDWRDNRGGPEPGPIPSWFLNGDPLYVRVGREGAPATTRAQPSSRLPDAYQLPIAIVMNRRSGGQAESIALALRESGRATIVGAQSSGCLGASNRHVLPGGGALYVAAEEFVGAATGARYHNKGIDPDIVIDEATAIESATRFLQSKMVP